jgi:hypothetical protein
VTSLAVPRALPAVTATGLGDLNVAVGYCCGLQTFVAQAVVPPRLVGLDRRRVDGQVPASSGSRHRRLSDRDRATSHILGPADRIGLSRKVGELLHGRAYPATLPAATVHFPDDAAVGRGCRRRTCSIAPGR